MKLSDTKWDELVGSSRSLFDPRPALKELLLVPDSRHDWLKLWVGLYNKERTDAISYACATYFAKIAVEDVSGGWNPFALAATIEALRYEPDSAPLPGWMRAEYEEAWSTLFRAALKLIEQTTNETASASSLALIAFHKGQRTLGRLALLGESERAELLDVDVLR